MTRKEALEYINNMWMSGETHDALEVLIPEFGESEDERIRKQLVDIVAFIPEANFTSASREDCRIWLEKQKEPKPILEVFGFKVGDAVRLKDGDGRKHIIKSFKEVEGLHGPNFYHVEFEDNSAGDGIYPGEEYPNGYYTQMEKFEKEQKPDTRDADDLQLLGFIYDLLNEIEWKDNWAMSKDECLRRLNNYRPQKPTEWKPQPVSLEALMYAIEGKWDMIKPTSYLSRRLEDLYEGLVNTYNVDEPLIAELPKTAYTAKDIEELKVLKDKIEASMESPVDKPAECEDCAMYLSGNCIHPNGKCENVKSKQEWSEEDEKMLNEVLDRVTYAFYEQGNEGEIEDDPAFLWLHRLRPSWKPREEHLSALLTVFNDPNNIGSQTCQLALTDLYEQLKKL